MSKQISGEPGQGAHASLRADRGHPARIPPLARLVGSDCHCPRPYPARALQAISLCLATVLIASVFFTPPGVAQRESGARARASRRASQSKAVATSPGDVALLAATATVLKETSEIRELSILRQVRSATQSRAEIERMIVKNMNEETTPADIHATEITLKKLGLAPPEFQYRQFLIKLLTEQVAGYYEPKSKRFYLADWIDLDAQKPVMAHELTHALQDQHFNLRRFEHWPKGNSDAGMAAQALVEGDATLAMALYIAKNPMGALAFLKAMKAGVVASQQLESAPRALRESLLFPYLDGSNWARSLYKRGGWSSVSQAFSELPTSTEQIMHPEKYFAHEPPVKVDLRDITNLLNAKSNSVLSPQSAVLTSAWRRVDYDVNGEWGYYLILDEFLKSRDESKRAAAGWGGDRYSVYEQIGSPANGKTNRPSAEDKASRKPGVLLVQLSVWDTEKDAREFFDAYVKRIQLRYPGATPLPNTQNPSPNTRAFGTSEGTVMIDLRGSRVLVLEGIPDRIDPRALLKSLRQW